MTSTKEKLLEYAQMNGYEYFDEERLASFHLFTNEPVSRTKRLAIKIPFGDAPLYYCAYDSYSTKAYAGNTYSGLYTSPRLDTKQQHLLVQKRDWLDYLSFKRRVLTGDRYSDSKLTIHAQPDVRLVKNWNRKTTDLFLKVHDTIAPVRIELKENYWSALPGMNTEMTLGIETNQWMTDSGSLERFVKDGKKLLTALVETGL